MLLSALIYYPKYQASLVEMGDDSSDLKNECGKSLGLGALAGYGLARVFTHYNPAIGLIAGAMTNFELALCQTETVGQMILHIFSASITTSLLCAISSTPYTFTAVLALSTGSIVGSIIGYIAPDLIKKALG